MSELSESELPAIALLKQLGYEYFDAKKEMYDVVLQERLRSSLKRINPWLNANALQKVMRKVEAVNGSSLMEINAEIHQLITKADAFSLKPTPDAHPIPVKFIDFEHIDNNDFLVVNQMKFKGAGQNSIPDLVIFVNGLPLVVIEAKNQTVDISDLGDLAYYERNSPKLFHYNQIMSGINRVNALYGTIGSPMQFYSKFNEAPTQTLIDLIDREVTPQDVMIFNLFQKEVFLDIIKYFVIFEVVEGKTIKKLPRYQQLRAVNKIVHRLKTKKQGGVVWHTQGSGKSITMIYLASKLRATTTGFDNPTILVVTDRKDLDAQIASTFRRTGFPNPIQTNSIAHLKSLLRDDYGKTLTTTIQKFQEKAEEKKQVEILCDKENIFVLIDEAHRSQYGLTASYMRKSLPNAKFIAFTGTPIDKENKSTLKEFYGGDYIDKYTIKQSVADGNTLPILYGSGLPELFIEKSQMDAVFNDVFSEASTDKKALLKKKAASLDSVLLAKRRVTEIAKHIIKHFKNKIRPDGFKAMLVCHNRKQVIAYKKAFAKLKDQGLNPYETKAVMSFDTKKDPKEYYELAVNTADIKKAIEDFKLPFGDENDKSLADKKQFDNTAILIVSDMLLTGYDAPILQTLYLDKVLREHNLLQAIARVNRTRKGKSAGYVVDYVGITKHLVEALEIFSGDLNPNDVMTDIEGEKTTLENNHTRLVNYFKKCNYDRKEHRDDFILKAVEFLKPQDIKDEFKKILADFNRSMNIVLPAPFAAKYNDDFKLFNELKLMVRDAKEKITREDSRKLQLIIDEHLRASGIEYLLGEPIDISDYQKFEIELTKKGQHSPLDKAQAIIKANKEDNPALALELSALLKRVLTENKDNRQEAFAEFLTQMKVIIERHATKHIAVGLKSEEQLVVYNLVEEKTDTPTQFTLAVYEALAPYLQEKALLAQSNVQKDMRNALKPLLKAHKLARALSKVIVQKLVDDA